MNIYLFGQFHIFKGDKWHVFWLDKNFNICLLAYTVWGRSFKLCVVITLPWGWQFIPCCPLQFNGAQLLHTLGKDQAQYALCDCCVFKRHNQHSFCNFALECELSEHLLYFAGWYFRGMNWFDGFESTWSSISLIMKVTLNWWICESDFTWTDTLMPSHSHVWHIVRVL